ncbi:MAG: hypothetical protein AAF349_21830, partial [Cyanobacteria bacterium P01_A01_bin.68]
MTDSDPADRKDKTASEERWQHALGLEARAPLLFGELFYGLRKAGLKIGVGDWIGLMEALRAGAIQPDLSDFY